MAQPIDALVETARSLDSTGRLPLARLEFWKAQFFQQESADEALATGQLDSLRSRNLAATSELLDFETENLARRLNATTGSFHSEIKEIQDKRRPRWYVKGPDLTLAIGRFAGCELRCRVNPCVANGYTKLWLYAFVEADSDTRFGFVDSLEFSREAEAVCDEVIRALTPPIESQLSAEATDHQVVIYNLGTDAKLAGRLIRVNSAADWDALIADEGEAVPMSLFDMLSRLARRELIARSEPASTPELRSLPFVTSYVDVTEGEDVGDHYEGLFAQDLFDNENKVCVSGIAFGEKSAAWHRPAQAITLKYVTAF